MKKTNKIKPLTYWDTLTTKQPLQFGIMIGIVLGFLLIMAVFVVAEVDWEQPDSYYYEPLTIAEFKLLTDEELSFWNVEFRGTEGESQDIVYYFYMNTYFVHIDEDDFTWVIPTRTTLYIQCYEELDCAEFYYSELADIQESEFQYFKDLQDEL